MLRVLYHSRCVLTLTRPLSFHCDDASHCWIRVYIHQGIETSRVTSEGAIVFQSLDFFPEVLRNFPSSHFALAISSKTFHKKIVHDFVCSLGSSFMALPSNQGLNKLFFDLSSSSRRDPSSGVTLSHMVVTMTTFCSESGPHTLWNIRRLRREFPPTRVSLIGWT